MYSERWRRNTRLSLYLGALRGNDERRAARGVFRLKTGKSCQNLRFCALREISIFAQRAKMSRLISYAGRSWASFSA
jgi:hypothetical protein